MRILQICNKSPYPAIEGGPIAMNALTQSLLRLGHYVKILAVNTPKYHVDAADVSEDYKQATHIEWCNVDTSFSVKEALKCLVCNRSYHVYRFYNRQMALSLQQILTSNSYDVVILETVYMAEYIPIIRKYSRAKIVLRAHNVEHKVWYRVLKSTPNIIKRAYLHILAYQLKQYEIHALSLCDAVWTISHKDADYFAACGGTRISVLPFATDIQQDSNNAPAFDITNIFTLGSMDWAPNVDGLMWFLRTAWPAIHEAYPTLILKLAGRNMPPIFAHMHLPQVEVVGEVPNAKQFMQENGVLLVPLLSGSGIRIKIIEAMSLAKVVITTSIGVEGIEAEHQKHVLIADNTSQFLQAIDYCMQHTEACEYMQRNAQLLIREHHSYAVVNAIVSQLLQTVTR